MKERGWQVHGCDISTAVCASVARRFSVKTHCGDVSTLSKETAYDVVVMNHVLEHVESPLEMLAEVRCRMAAGGLLHLAVPNAACWEALFPSWTSYEPYHLVYFTPDTIRKLMDRAEFRVHHISTHESFSGWFLVLLRALLGQRHKSARERMTGRRRRSSSSIEHMYGMAMVTAGVMSWPFRRFQEMVGCGDEVIVLAGPR
jgi:SAM-dependent methyltransferase